MLLTNTRGSTRVLKVGGKDEMGQEDSPTVWPSYEATILVTILKMLKIQALVSSTQTFETNS